MLIFFTVNASTVTKCWLPLVLKASSASYAGVFYGAEISGFDTLIGHKMSDHYTNPLRSVFTSYEAAHG
tara:strand:- start:1002 stop:1208 length:207 start_codon:yes stop_codon:yes gene_type:complete